MKEVNIEDIIYRKTSADIVADGETYKKVSLEALLKWRISKGAIDRADFDKFLQENEMLTAKESLFNTLARSSYKSEFEYRQRLRKKQFSDISIDYAIGIAKEYGYIDDLFFAKKFIEYNKTKMGEFKIRYELSQKRVAQSVIDEAIAESGLDETETCSNILEKYLNKKPLNFKTKQKAYRFLLYKGFSYDTANSSLDKFDFADES